ncbi:MAG: extracellular solute-binding protein [Clostridia bacterium]|nr:extracellular solute-binding protein [Clostridia bacterium]
MKMSRIVSLILVVVMVVSLLVSCNIGGNNNGGNGGNTGDHPYADLNGTYDIKMWVSELTGVDEQFQEQINAFMAKYPGIVINAEISGVTEADSGSSVVADVVSAPDIYCFAQDQLARLVQAGALAKPIPQVKEEVEKSHDSGSVSAASVDGTMYAYPLTADNGYYMYYDTSLITEEDAQSLERLIEICEENNKLFRFALNNAWYTASFFFATGCTSEWVVDGNGQFVSYNDTWNSDAGLIAMKGMKKLAQSSCYNPDNNIFSDAAVVITGTWATTAAEEYFGDNLGATDLPSFEVDGKSYHLGSYTGYKFMGVKPQTDGNRAAVLSLLAAYLTSEECQMQRFEKFGWGPSHIEAQKDEGVKNAPSLVALALQGEYGIPQAQIPGDWWNTAKVLGSNAKDYSTDSEYRDCLKAYSDALAGLLSK